MLRDLEANNFEIFEREAYTLKFLCKRKDYFRKYKNKTILYDGMENFDIEEEYCYHHEKKINLNKKESIHVLELLLGEYTIIEESEYIFDEQINKEYIDYLGDKILVRYAPEDVLESYYDKDKDIYVDNEDLILGQVKEIVICSKKIDNFLKKYKKGDSEHFTLMKYIDCLIDVIAPSCEVDIDVRTIADKYYHDRIGYDYQICVMCASYIEGWYPSQNYDFDEGLENICQLNEFLEEY